MASDQVQVLLDPQADEDTQQAVLAVLSRAGLVGSTSVREGKGLPDVPWGDIPWNHVVTLVLQQGQGLAEDARGFLAGLVLEHFRQKLAQRRSGVETPSTAAPAPTSASGRLAAARQLRTLVQDLQQLQVHQVTEPVQVRLVIGDLWVTCPDASTCGDAPFLALLDPLDIDEVGGFFGATRWDATRQRWVPEE